MQSPAPTPRRADLAALCILAAMSVAFFWQGLVRPAAMIHEDAASYYQPWYTMAAREIQAGRLPLWNPYVNLGIPYHAGLQASLFYPLRWPLFWIDFVHGYPLLLWVHYSLTGAAAYAFLRACLRVGAIAALAGAMSVTFGGFAMGHQTHLTYFMAYPWFLLAVLCIWRSVERRQWTWSVGAGVCIGIMGIIGAVHLLLILSVLLGTYVAWHVAAALTATIRRRAGGGEIARPVVSVGLAGMIGAGIGAIQLVPAYALVGRSVRQEIDWRSINAACAHPVRNTLQLVTPWYFGNLRLGYWGEYNYQDMAHYAGVLVLMGAAGGLAVLGRDRHRWFLPVLAIVGFIVGAGEYLPVYGVLYDHLPGFSQLRNPARIFWCTHIALAGLAAIGLDAMVRCDPRRLRWPVLLAGGAVLVVIGAALVQLTFYAHHPDVLVRKVQYNPKVYEGPWKPLHLQAAREVPGRIINGTALPEWGQIAVAILTVIAVSVPVLRPGTRRWSAPLIVVLLGAELFALSFGTMQYQFAPHEHRALVGVPPQASWLQERLGNQRYCVFKQTQLPRPDDQVTDNRGMQFGLRNLQGVGGGILDNPERLQFCLVAAQSRNLSRICGVKYALSDRRILDPQFAPLGRVAHAWAYENAGALPMVRFVQELHEVSGPEEALRVLTGPDFDPAAEAVVQGTPPEDTRAASARDARVLEAQSVPGRWDIRCRTDAPAQLVIAEGFEPGWRGTIDGLPAPILRTNGEFMSVRVPAGESRVVLDYAPKEFRVGAWITVASLIGTGVLATIVLWERRKAAGHANITGS